MVNPFCCRGKLGALPLVVLGFAFILSWHYMSGILGAARNAAYITDPSQSQNIRGAKEDAQMLNKRIDALNKIPERDVLEEARLSPNHLIDGGVKGGGDEEELEDRIGQDLDEIWAADEGQEAEDSMKMVDKEKLDSKRGSSGRRPSQDHNHHDERLGDVKDLIKEALREGAVAPDDGMKFIEKEEKEERDDIPGTMPPLQIDGFRQAIPPVGEAAGVLAKSGGLNAVVERDVPEAQGDQQVEPQAIELNEPALSEYVSFDLSVDGNPQSPMVFQMSLKEAPITVKNFEQLCEGFTNDRGTHLSYSGLSFHRIIHDFMMQGGMLHGAGPHSIYGDKWDDEPTALAQKHLDKGYLSMANAGPNTNSSQFFVTFKATPHLDGHHAVFGKLVDGFDTLDMVNSLEIVADKTVVPVVLESCSIHKTRPVRQVDVEDEAEAQALEGDFDAAFP